MDRFLKNRLLGLDSKRVLWYSLIVDKAGHLPKEYYQNLGEGILSKVCRCGAKSGWTLNLETEWWVCSDCKKPSLLSSMRVCENCDARFIPPHNPGVPPSDWSDLCYKCETRIYHKSGVSSESNL